MGAKVVKDVLEFKSAKAKGLRYLPHADATCSRCLKRIKGEAIEVLEEDRIPIVRRYHVKCFIWEYMPLFERLRGAVLEVTAR